jgi:Domain of unknown function (DU1801)
MAKKKVVRSKARKSGSANKTTLTSASVPKYIASIADEGRRADCRALIKIMTAVTRKPPRMWGSSIVGFGQYHYKYESGREGDICLAGFSSRKADLTIYVMTRSQEELLAKLGKHRASKACVYVKHLADVDTAVLKKLIATSVAAIKRLYP